MRGTSAIHRISAFWGLAALAPVALLLFQDELSLLQAGVRSLGILTGVICLRWITDRVVRGVASTLDRQGESAPEISRDGPGTSRTPVSNPEQSA